VTDAETTAAVEALTWRLRERDAAIRDGQDYADPEVFAAETITALRGFGWRPTPARLYPAPKADPATPSSSRHAELLAPLRAQLEELNEAKRHAREDGAA
jgi:hypothetical protein